MWQLLSHRLCIRLKAKETVSSVSISTRQLSIKAEQYRDNLLCVSAFLQSIFVRECNKQARYATKQPILSNLSLWFSLSPPSFPSSASRILKFLSRKFTILWRAEYYLLKKKSQHQRQHGKLLRSYQTDLYALLSAIVSSWLPVCDVWTPYLWDLPWMCHKTWIYKVILLTDAGVWAWWLNSSGIQHRVDW